MNKSSVRYVKKLFKKNGFVKMKSGGTQLGNIKTELMKIRNKEFIKKNDLKINKVIRDELYG